MMNIQLNQELWRKQHWIVANVILTLFVCGTTGALQESDKTTVHFDNDAVIIKVAQSDNEISHGPTHARHKRQVGFPGFGAGVFPPGWPFVNQQVSNPGSIASQYPQLQLPQFPPFQGFPGINNNLHQQVTQPPATQPPATHPPQVGVSGPCVTNNGLRGYCASFRSCYPIVYSPDDGHILNNGLAEMYMNNSGPCNSPGLSNFFMFRADYQVRQSQICCGSSTGFPNLFPGFPNLFPFPITNRPPGAFPPRVPTAATTTSTTTTTTTTPKTWWTPTPTTARTTTSTTTNPWWPPPPTPTTTTVRSTNWWDRHTTTSPPWTQPTTARPTQAPSSSSCGVGSIVGGQQAGQGEFPWLVALIRNQRQVCGGTLIDNQYILTAAHCFNGVTQHELRTLFKVYIGDYDLHTLDDGPMTVKNIEKLILHRDFNQRTFYNDIALIKLDSPVQFGANGNNNIRPICLSGGGTYEGQSAVVAGWGRTSVQSSFQPGKYRKVDLKVWNLQQCAATYGHQAPGGITQSMMCAGVTNKDSCLGDSGGPLMRKNGNVWEQIGIVSWGIGCGQYPGVYTKVGDYQDWISRHRY